MSTEPPPPATYEALRDPDDPATSTAKDSSFDTGPQTPLVPIPNLPAAGNGSDTGGGDSTTVTEPTETDGNSIAKTPTLLATKPRDTPFFGNMSKSPSTSSMTWDDLQARRDALLHQNRHRPGRSLDMTRALAPPSSFPEFKDPDAVDRMNRSSFSIDITRALDDIGSTSALKAILQSEERKAAVRGARTLPVPPRTPTKLPAPPLRMRTPPTKPALLSPGSTLVNTQPSPQGKLLPDVNVAALDDETTVFFIDDNTLFPEPSSPVTPILDLSYSRKEPPAAISTRVLDATSGITNSARVSAVGGVSPVFHAAEEEDEEYSRLGGARGPSFSAVGGSSSLADEAAGETARSGSPGLLVSIPEPPHALESSAQESTQGSNDNSRRAAASPSMTEEDAPPETPGGPRINAADAPKEATSLAASADGLGLGLGLVDGLQRIAPVGMADLDNLPMNGRHHMASLGAVGGKSMLRHLKTTAPDTKNADGEATWNASVTAIHGGSEGQPTHRRSDQRRLSIDSVETPISPTPMSPGQASITSTIPPTPKSPFGMLGPHDTTHGLDPAASTTSITAIRGGTEGGRTVLVSPLTARGVRARGGFSGISTPAISTRQPSPFDSATATPFTKDSNEEPASDAEENLEKVEPTQAEIASEEKHTSVVEDAFELDDKPPVPPEKDRSPSLGSTHSRTPSAKDTVTAPSPTASVAGGVALAAGGVAALTAAAVSSAPGTGTTTPAETPGVDTEAKPAPGVPAKEFIARIGVPPMVSTVPAMPPVPTDTPKKSPTPSKSPMSPSIPSLKTPQTPKTPKRIPVPKLEPHEMNIVEVEEREKWERSGSKPPSKPPSKPSSQSSSTAPSRNSPSQKSLEDLAPGPRDQEVGAPASKTMEGTSREPRRYPTPQIDGPAEERFNLRAGDMEEPVESDTLSQDKPSSPRATPPPHAPRAASADEMEMIRPTVSANGVLIADDKDETSSPMRNTPGRANAPATTATSMFVRRPSISSDIPPWRPEPGYQGVSGLGIENRPLRSHSRSASAIGLAKAAVASTAGAAKSASSAISRGVRSVSAGNKLGGGLRATKSPGSDVGADANASANANADADRSQVGLSSPSSPTDAPVGLGIAGIGLGHPSTEGREAHQVHQRTTSSTSSARRRRMGLLTKLKSEMKVLSGKLSKDGTKIAKGRRTMPGE